MDRSIFGVLAQPIKVELKLSDSDLGFLTGFAFSAVLLAAGFPMARMTDKGNRVAILTICTAAWSVMTALCGIGTNFIQMTLARMGVGVGEAACLPASHSLITDYFPPEKRTKSLAIYGLGYPMGWLLGAMMGGVIADHWGWRAAFYVVGLPGVILALLTWLIVKEPPRARYDVGAAEDLTKALSFREVSSLMWRSPSLRQMTFALTMITFFCSPASVFLGAYLVRRFSLSLTEIGFVMGTGMMLGASISTFFGGGVLAQWLGKRDQRWLLWLPAVATAAGAPFYIVSFLQTNWIVLAVLVFFGAVLNATYLAPCYTVLHNAIPPGGRAKAVVIIQALMGVIGASLGPYLAGLAIDMTSAHLFGDFAAQGFAASCPGGQGAPGAAVALDAKCRSSLADATQIVLVATMVLAIWPCWHFYLGGRALPKKPAHQGSALPV
jgi:MFS family permease